MPERWTRAIIRFRWAVIASWVVVFVVAFMLSSGLADVLKSESSLPGTDAQKVEDILKDNYGQRTYGTFTLVVRGDAGSAEALAPAVEAAAERAAAEVPTGSVAAVQQVSDRVVSAEIASTLQPHDAGDYTAAMRQAVGNIEGAQVWLTGGPALDHDLAEVFAHDLEVGELYIAIPIALAILVFVFATLAFLIPLIFALAVIPTTLAGVWALAHLMPMAQSVQNLVALIGLGIAIDYSLFLVYRYRDDRRAGLSQEDAVVNTMKTAGHAVIFSGTAVAIGLALLMAVPVPEIRGYGVAGLLVPVVSLVCAVTLMPAILYVAEPKLDRVRLVPKRIVQRRESRTEQNFWVRHAHRVMRRPVVFLATSLALLLAAAAPVSRLDLGPGTQEQLPQDVTSVQGLRVLQTAVGDGALNPTEVIVDTGRAGGFDDPAVQAAEGRLYEAVGSDPEIASITDFGQGRHYIDPSERYVHFEAISKHDAGVPESEALVERLRDVVIPAAGFPEGTQVYVGGQAAAGVDFLDKTYGVFPWLVAAVLILTYFLLLRAFRSLLLPLKAIVLNVLSIAAAYGLLVVAFKWGGGEALGLIQYDQITGWIPVFLFALLFGLSMDYEVFLVSRMREEWDATKDNVAAVSLGLAKTGRLVTAAGLIMFAAFMGFVVGSFVDLQQFGFGLAVAILIDVTIVRALLLPSAMRLFGRWNWWLPARVARVFRVEPSPLEPGPDIAIPRPAGR
jgi:RND superfamily putative drug exporter